MANEWDREKSQKRGGGQAMLTLDKDETETRYRAEPIDEMTPEKAYERRWALTLLEAAVERLRQEFVAAGKARQFEQLKGFLSGETADGDYAPPAAALNMPTGSVAVAVHRLRQKYREAVRAEIAHTLANPAEIDEEMRHLFAALG